MTIASEITRLQGAKANIKTAIEGKGVTVPSNALLDTYNTYINAIVTGTITGLVYESGTYTPTQDIARPEISFTNSHNNPPVFLLFYDATGTMTDSNTSVLMVYYDPWRLFGAGYKYTSSADRYCNLYYIYRGTSSTSLSTSSTQFSYDSDDTRTSTSSYPRYWVSNTNFHPYTGSSSRYWRANRTYKWIAVWK